MKHFGYIYPFLSLLSILSNYAVSSIVPMATTSTRFYVTAVVHCPPNMQLRGELPRSL